MKKGFFNIVFLFVCAFALAQTPKKPPQTKTATTGSAASAGLKSSIERGKLVYNNFCLACHQLDGGGVPKMNPPLIKTKWVLGDKKELISITLKGMTDPIEIDDEEYHNPMPPQSHLTDQQIADVLTYIRNSFGNKASAVSVGEVKAVRTKLK